MASRFKQLQDMLEDAIIKEDDDQIQILKAELFNMNPNYKDGGKVSSSAQGSVIKGAKAKSSAEGSVIKMKSGGLAKRGYGKAKR
jgi:hypothetical protein